VWTPEPGTAHLNILERLLDGGDSPRHVTDAHIAALAIEHGLTLCSLDRGVARWEAAGLRWKHPFAR
jgi:predicted nucleic acid-binding protein